MNAITKKTARLVAIATLALALTPAFADVIHLRSGEKIQDATVVKVGEKEVEYKIGEKEVIYTAKKSNIVIILYADGTEDVFDNKKSKREQSDSDNFSNGRRWATLGVNAVLPGVGSAGLMKDWTGAYISWGLIGGGVGLFGIANVFTAKDGCSNNLDCLDGRGNILLYSGIVIMSSGYIWNIYRTITYDKPQPATASKYGNLNMAILPSRQGNGMAYGLMYSGQF